MLTRLSIRNIVLIEALDLDFAPGLGVLTGETGAGKSILLDALGLVLGDRAEVRLVRAGEAKASVTASFEFADLPQFIAEELEEADIECEPGEPLLIRRQVKADGGSKAFVNDQPVSAALLRSLAPALVELHGQHDDRGLVNPRGHLALLDRYAGTDLEGLRAAYEGWARAEAQLAEARRAVEQAKADEELLRAHLAELETLAPEVGEEQTLAEQRIDLQKGEKLSGDLEELRHMWEGSDSPLANLRVAARKLDRIAGEHELLTEALAALDRAVIEAGEAEDKLIAAGHALIHDPQALDAAETRLFELRALARKHRCEVDGLPGLIVEMRGKLEAIEGGEAHLGGLEKAAGEAREAYVKASAKAS
ncbi:MAG: AAA family ATPase, partial [Pseudomonadota bacterium]